MSAIATRQENALHEREDTSHGVAATASMTLMTFRLAGELFALPVECVNELVDNSASTLVPGGGAFASSLINVRGSVVPLLDVRERLEISREPLGVAARIIVLELTIDGELTKLGLLAESVDSVRELPTEAIAPMPELGARWPSRYILGVARLGDQLVVILNVETLFSRSG